MDLALYSMDFRHSNGNMHVGVSGEFNVNTARDLIELLKSTYSGSGRVFIDTAKIQRVAAGGAEYFKKMFHNADVPTACLFFKGEQGRQIGPDGSKLIILKAKEKKHCCGNCANCKCKNHGSHPEK